MNRRLRFVPLSTALSTAILACLIGCAAGPNYAKPGLHAGPGWRAPSESSNLSNLVSMEAVQERRWWQEMGDPTLEALVQRVMAENPGRQEALARIREARAVVNASIGGLLPTVDVTGEATRRDISDNGNPNIGNLGAGGMARPPFTLYSAGLDASWEAGIFGSAQRTIEAVSAELESAEANGRAVTVTLLGEVGAAYAQLRTAQQRLAVARESIKIQDGTLAIISAQFEEGQVSSVERDRARASAEQIRATLPLLEIDRQRALNRLNIAAGEFPGELNEALSRDIALPRHPNVIRVGIPVDVIRRRPDVETSERALAAQSARIGIAEAELYPTITLNGSFTFVSTETGNWFDKSSRAFVAGPSIRWPILDFGTLRNLVKVEESRFDQARFRYEQAVLSAVAEVEDAITAYVQARAREASLLKALQASQSAERVAGIRYKEGDIAFFDLLDSQRLAALARDEYTRAQGTSVGALIALYKAVGGSWQV